jgi:hypothetical protein
MPRPVRVRDPMTLLGMSACGHMRKFEYGRYGPSLRPEGRREGSAHWRDGHGRGSTGSP